MKISKYLSRAVVYIFLIAVFIISIFPFYWMIVGMTNTAADVIKGRMTFGNQLINNFKTLLTSYNLGRIFLNSVKVSSLTVIGTLIVSSMAAYGFEIYYSKKREVIYSLILITMMIPFAALMIPLFRLIVQLGLLDTHFGLIITSIASAFIIFLFRQSFNAISKETIEAARVDGAGEFTIFFKIIIPTMKSTYAAAAIYSFMTSWNSYLWPLIILQSDKQKTMTLLISNMSSAYFPDYGAVMAAIVVATLPMIIIFFALQRYFVQGLTGAVKQ